MKKHSQTAPGYNNTFEEELKSLYDQIISRPAFSYDAGSDALYQQYKENYTLRGLAAMQDTMAQAAHLTGGYGSTYAQAVGQQQYGKYMQELTALMPELYDRALGAWQAGTDRLYDAYALTNEQAEAEYGRYQDELQQYNTQLNYLTDQAKNAYTAGFENWQATNAERDTAYKKLTELMEYSGYVPTEDDLTRSGMTREQAEAYLKAWKAANPLLAWQTGAITTEEYIALTGTNPPGVGGGGGGYWYSGSRKKKDTETVDVFDIVSQRAQIEADYNAGRIDYDDREQLVNKLYGWK